jgi:hypothetical protein
MLSFTGAQTFAGDSRVRAQARAESGSGFATARAAHHGAILPHGQRGTGGAGQPAGRIRDGLEQRVEAVVSGCNQFFQRRKGGVFVEIFRGSGSVGEIVGGFCEEVLLFFVEPNGLEEGTTTVVSRMVSCRTKPAERQWLGRFRRSMSQLGVPVKASDAPVVLQF